MSILKAIIVGLAVFIAVITLIAFTYHMSETDGYRCGYNNGYNYGYEYGYWLRGKLKDGDAE